MRLIFFPVGLLVFLSVILALPVTYLRLPFFQVDEKEAYSYFLQGLSLYNQNSYEASKFFFQKSISIKPDFYFSRRFLADAYFLSGEVDNALQEYSILKNRYPYDEYLDQRTKIIEDQLISYRLPAKSGFFLYRIIKPQDIKETGWIPIEMQKDEKNIFVLNYKPPEIYIFDREGSYQGKLSAGILSRFLESPGSLLIHDDVLFVSDQKLDRVYLFDKNRRNLVAQLSVPFPSGMAIYKGFLFVWSQRDRKFYKFTLQGDFLQTVEIKGMGSNPENVKLVSDGDVFYIVESSSINMMDEAGYVYDTLIFPHGNIKNFFAGKSRIVVVDGQDRIWISHNRNDWEEFSEFSTMDEGQINKQKWKNISDVFLDDELLLVTDFAGFLYMFQPQDRWGRNLFLNILSAEVHDFPDVALHVVVRDTEFKPLTNLENKHFQIFENDKRIFRLNASNFELFQNRVHFLLLKDTGFAVSPVFEKIFKEKILEFVNAFRIQDTLDFALMDDNLKVIYSGKYGLEIYEYLRNFQYTPQNTVDVLENLHQAIQILIPKKGKKGIVIFTDKDLDHGNEDDFRKIKALLDIHEISLFVVSFENLPRWRDFLMQTGGVFLQFLENANYRQVFDSVLAKKVSGYIITYKSPLPYDENLKDTYINVRIRLQYFQFGGMAEGGYAIP